jgi:hypothetical protein
LVRLEYRPVLGRTIRMDDLDTLGVGTQTLAEDAIAAGDWEGAAALVRYYYDEMRIMHGILTTWIQDIQRYIVEHAGAEAEQARAASAGLVRTLWAYPIGQAGRDRCLEALAGRTGAAAVDWLERMRLEFKNPHELLVAQIQDLLTYIAETWGEEQVLDSMQQTYQSIWGDRYARWDQMTPHEKLALTVEGMRGGHFSGLRRRGDMLLIDEGDRYRMVMDPCGSGGVLRRGDPETGRGPYPITEHGTNRQLHLWTWQKTGVHWYCTHCCFSMEWLPGRVRGRPLRPLDHVLDPGAPCTWYIYKDEAHTRAYHYARSGLATPSDAPQWGEDPQVEYPGGPGRWGDAETRRRGTGKRAAGQDAAAG